MDINKYELLTGTTVAPESVTQVNAVIRRTKAKLETLLGFSLSPKNLYNELGKATQEWACPDVDISTLLPPDEVQGIYKLFSYNELDKNLHIDPFKNVYSAKLVYVTADYNFVTVRTFDEVKPQYGRDGIGKYIEKYENCLFPYSNLCDCDEPLQLAVEADWITCYPDDILYLWADMIEYYSDCNKNIKSENIEGHSFTKTNTTAPEEELNNISVLRRYAGPHSSISGIPT